MYVTNPYRLLTSIIKIHSKLEGFIRITNTFITMKKVMKLSFVAACAMAFASCAVVSTPAGMGGLYTNVTSGEAVTGNSLGSKVGTSSASNILGIIASGDASIQTAARSAGIKKISHIDSKKNSILGIFATYKTIVYGE